MQRYDTATHRVDAEWIRGVSSLLLYQGGKYNNRSQASHGHLSRGHNYVITKIQCILLRIHQYRIRLLQKLGQDLLIADWLSQQNHSEDKEILGMRLSTDGVHTSTYM